jgi:hypothetical protein
MKSNRISFIVGFLLATIIWVVLITVFVNMSIFQTDMF